MSLYEDDLDMDAPEEEESEKDKGGDKTRGAADITMKFLQAQIQQRRSTFNAAAAMSKTVAPVVDLSARNRQVGGQKPLRPIKATPVANTGLPLFLPRAAVEDKVQMFGEVVIENEYQPAVPNDYVIVKRKKEEREAKEKIAREIAERLAREHQDEEKKREKGAAIAPPSFLQEESVTTTSSTAPPPVFAVPAFTPAFGGKSLGVAANIMSRMGYREGAGLGRTEQGMSSALSIEKTGRNAGVILENSAPAAPPTPPQSQNIAVAIKDATRILLLKNMVQKGEVDDELVPEIKEEMSKYGQVSEVVIHEMDGGDEEDQVRVFVEYTNVAQAIKAFVVQSGRFFAGRPVKAQFFPIDDYNTKNFAK